MNIAPSRDDDNSKPHMEDDSDNIPKQRPTEELSCTKQGKVGNMSDIRLIFRIY